jgi:branched-chain amino acid transport system permease protein
LRVAEPDVAERKHGPQRLPVGFGRLGLLAAAGLAMVAAGPYVLDDYSVNILVRSFLYGAIAVTVDILWGYTGILSFGQAAFFAIGAYGFGLASAKLDFSALVAIYGLLGGLAVAGLAAAVVGWLAFGYGVSPLYISIVTLVLSIVFVQVIYSGGNFTGSSSGLSGFDTFDIPVEGWFWIAGAALVVTMAAGWMLVRSDAGRLLVSIRDNEQRCSYFGIPTARIKTLLLIGSALVAALAGYAYSAYTDVIAPDLGNFQFGTELVIWAALGGRGTLIGPAVAAVLIDFVSAYLSGSLPFIWQLIVGTVFIVVIVLMPQGLGPTVAGAVRRLLPKGRVRPATAALAPAAAAPALATDRGAAISVSNLSRRYGSLLVLEDVSFAAERGEMVSLVGPNGAGKTTLIRCISDGHERSAGQVAIEGVAIGRRPPERCVHLGLGRKFQTPNVFDTLTVAESLRMARARHEPLSLWHRSALVRIPEAAMRVVRTTGLAEQLGTEVRHLSHGGKQALELAMVLAMEPHVLLLDEPTAGLSRPERQQIGAILTDLVQHHGLCVLLIEHDLEFVREISSRIIVLHQGRIVMDGSVGDVAGSALVRTIYTGERPESAGAAE